jgi:sugar phosphate permease
MTNHAKTNEVLFGNLQEGRTVSMGRTHVRWKMLFLISLMYLITYLDRVSISNAAPLLVREFGFSPARLGVVFSAFVWAYALFQVPGGWLGDRFGPRKTLTVIMLYRAFIALLTTRAMGIASLWSIRFALGVGEAGAFPTATRAMQMWFPREERGIVQGVSHSASRFGAAVGPPVAVVVMIRFGWRGLFVLVGIISVVWVLLFLAFYRDTPEEVEAVSEQELIRIRGIDDKGTINTVAKANGSPVPWKQLFQSGNMWAIMLAYFSYLYCLWIFLSWLPSYLVIYRGFSLLKTGFLASLPLLAGVVGDALGGWLTDFALIKTSNLKFARRSVAVLGMLGCACFILPAAITRSGSVALACLSMAMLFLEMIIGPAWAVPMDVGGEHAGIVSGMMNMCGQFGGALSPTVFGILAARGSWIAPFVIAAFFLIIGAAIWAFWIDPERPVIGAEGIVGRGAG